MCHPETARSKTGTRNPCRRFLDAPDPATHYHYIMNRAWNGLKGRQTERTETTGTPTPKRPCRKPTLLKFFFATFAIQYSHGCILLQDTLQRYRCRLFRPFSPFQNSQRSPEREQSLTQTMWRPRRWSSQAGTAGKPNWSPSAYHTSFQTDWSNRHVNHLSQPNILHPIV